MIYFTCLATGNNLTDIFLTWILINESCSLFQPKDEQKPLTTGREAPIMHMWDITIDYRQQIRYIIIIMKVFVVLYMCWLLTALFIF